MATEIEKQALMGKTVLIAGASGGIGSSTALRLAEAGAQVILSGRDQAKLKSLARQIRTETGVDRPPILPADLTNASEVEEMVRQAAAYGEGRLDILINAAGVGAIKAIEALTPEDFQTLLAVNLYGAMILSQAALRVMGPQRSGHLLHLVGILGKAPMANATAYCASKYGLSGFLGSLRAEVGRRYNIKVTALYLSGVDTPFYDNPAVEIRPQRERLLAPEDAARAVLYALTQPAHLVLGDLTLQPEYSAV